VIKEEAKNMRKSKVVELVRANMRHHEVNEHMYRHKLSGGGRMTTRISKDELLDLILDHLGLEVVEQPSQGILRKKETKE